MNDADKNLESRLTRLEENSWFQEETLRKLDIQLHAQQKQLDSMSGALKALASQVRRLQEQASEQTNQGGQDAMGELPPHYQATHWHD